MMCESLKIVEGDFVRELNDVRCGVHSIEERKVRPFIFQMTCEHE